MDANSSLQTFLRKKLLLCTVYVFSAILNSLCMIHAVLIGATGGLVPTDSMWFMIFLPFPMHVFYLTEALFITFLPLFLVGNLNLIIFRYTTKRKGHSPLGNLSRLIFGVILAFPLLYIAVAFYISVSFILGWWEIVIAWSGIAAGFLVLYQFCVSTVMTDNPKQYFLDWISSHRIWIIIIMFTGILLIPSAMLVNPLHQGYFRYFPTHEQFLLNLPDLVVRASLIGALLTLVQYGFQYFTIRLEQKTEYQEKRTNPVKRVIDSDE